MDLDAPRWDVVSKRTGKVWATTSNPNYLDGWVTRSGFYLRPHTSVRDTLAHFLLMSAGNYASPQEQADALLRRLDHEGLMITEKPCA